MSLKISFAPIVDNNSRILILGSLPGDLSIAEHQYYAHPQNRFWKILFHLFDQPFSRDYQKRKDLLIKNQIALWDVCGSAIRKGSMDVHIKEVSPNAISELLLKHQDIKHVFFNGQKAANLFDRYFERDPTHHFETLPSTSPANAQFSLDRLTQIWSTIKLPYTFNSPRDIP